MALAIALAVWLAACSGAPAPASPPETPVGAPPAAHGGRITGRAVFTGAVPPAERVRLDADPQCAAVARGDVHHVEDVVVDAGGLRNVFVHVTRGIDAAMPGEAPARAAAVLDQQGCRYVPRVVGVQVGQPLTIRNSDPLLHTVRGEAAANDRFNIGTPVQGMQLPRVFEKPEVMLPIRCDMHPWMTAFVGVVSHPFFDVTREGGRFAIDGLPPGTYTLEAWHERFGVRSRDVTVGAGETAVLTFEYRPS